MSQATIPDLPFNGSLADTVLFEISNSGVSESTDLASVVFGLQEISEKNVALGYAGLDGSGLLSVSQIPDLSGTYQILTEKDMANGYAGLDATALVLLGAIPELPQSRTTDLVSDLAARELLANKVTIIGTPGNDTNYPTEKATRDALDLKEDSLGFTPEDIANKVITVGTPGNDTNYPTEKAVRDALDLKEDSLGFTPENIVNKVTVVGTPGNDTNYPSEKAVRDALDLKEDSLGFTPEDVANKSTDLLLPDNTKYATTLAITTELGLYQLLSGKGAANGYAGLDASQELLIANFPSGTALQVLRRNAGNTALEFADVAAGGSQTPWTSNIDAAGFALLDSNYIEVGSVLATPFASIGHIRLPAEGSIAWRNDADDADFQIYSTADELTIEGWQTIVIPTAAVDIDLGNANVTGIETLELNGGGSMDYGDTPAFSLVSLQFTASNQVQAISLGNVEVISWEKNGGTGYAGVSSSPSNEFIIGFSAASPGSLSAEYTFTEIAADWKGNIITNVLAYETNAAFPATGGAVRLGDTETIAWRNFANDDNFTIGNNDTSFEFAGFEDLAGGDFTTIDFSGATMDLDSLNMGGIIAMTGNQITGVSFLVTGAATPADAGFLRMGNAEILAWRNVGDTANLTLSVNASDQFALNSVLTVGNNVIKAVDTPVDGTDAANKTYVDNLVNGLVWKDAADQATTSNITLSGEQTIDGILTSASRVLVKDQTLGEDNGVYTSGAGAWTRTTDTDTDVELNNMSIFISNGTVNAGSSWTQTTDLPITVGTTVLVYAQIGAGSINPLTTKGDIYGYDTGSARIPVGTDDQILVANSAVALGVEWQDAPQPLTTKGDLFTFDTAVARLPVGVTNQILSANAAEGTGLEWIDNELSPLTSKGDIYTFTTVNERIAVGSNGQVLSANAAQPTGLEWITLPVAGDVIGPAGATDNAIARYDTGTGKLIQNSGVLIDDNNRLTVPAPIVLTAAGTVPPGTETYFREVSNDLIVNVATAQEMDFNFGTTTRVTFTQSGIDLLTNDLAQATITSSSSLNATQVLSGLAYGNGIKQVFNPSSANAGLNVGAQADPDPSAPVNGDIYYNSTNNKFRAYENSVWVDMITTGGGEVFTWTADHSAARFNLENTGAIDFSLSGPLVTPAATQPYIAYDVGPVPDAMRINVPAARTIFFSVGAVDQMELTNAVLDLFGNNLDNVSIFTSNAGSPATTGVMRFGNNEEITWRNAANTGNNSIYYNASNEFQIEITNGVDYSFSETEFDANGNNVVGVEDLTMTGNLAFGINGALPAGATAQIWWDGSAYMGFNIPNADEYRLYINASEEYTFTQTEADFLNNSLINATITGATNTISGISEAMQTVAVGAAATVLTSNGVGVAPTYQALPPGGGDVVGPASSTDTAIALFDGVTGLLLQDSTVTIDADGDTVFPRSIQWAASATLPSSSIIYAQHTTSALRTNVPTGSTFVWTINGASEMNLSPTGLNIQDKNLTVGTAYIDIEEIATPALPAADTGRLYSKDVSTETHLFFINSSGTDIDLSLPVEDLTWSADHSANGFSLTDANAVGFNGAGTTLGNGIANIYSIASGIVLNVPTGDQFVIEINGSDRYTFSDTGVAFLNRNLTQVGDITFGTGSSPGGASGAIWWDNSTHMGFNVPTGDEFRWYINDLEQMSFSGTILDGSGAGGTPALLQNFSSLQMAAVSNMEVRFGATTSAVSTLIGTINFRADQSDAGLIDYCRIEGETATTTDATASGKMDLMCLEDGDAAPINYITLRGQLERIEMNKEIYMTNQAISLIGNLQFNSAVSTIAGTIAYIDKQTTEFVFNVPNAHTYGLYFNNILEYEISQSVFDLKGNNLNGVVTINDTNGLQLINMTQVASAVNEINISNAVTATNPILGVSGGDTNIGLDIATKGTGEINALSNVNISGNNLLEVQNVVHDQSAITYAATLAFNFNLDQEQTLAVTGDLTTLTTTNRAAGKSKSIFITGDTVNRTLTFNASWRTNPATATVTITANTFGLLTFGCKGGAETDVYCAYAEFV